MALLRQPAQLPLQGQAPLPLWDPISTNSPFLNGEDEIPTIEITSNEHDENVDDYIGSYRCACSVSSDDPRRTHTMSNSEAKSVRYLICHFIGTMERISSFFVERFKYLKGSAERRSSSASSDNAASTQDLLNHIPSYVLEYAPLVHLYSGEKYWPGDIEEHLNHVHPCLDYLPICSDNCHRNLNNLGDLTPYNESIFLTSDDDVTDKPSWFYGKNNIPSSSDAVKAGRSNAPAILITVAKNYSVVDAFWLFFYHYNLGNEVLKLRFGNHVGDWEYTTIRFVAGKPDSVFLSQHALGAAYTYDALEKRGKRPILYSAEGTHGMYPTPAVHKYVLPFGLLNDTTDRGPLWDPSLNMHSFTYNISNQVLLSSNITPDSPTSWFNYTGRWGDKAYPLWDRRQYLIFGQRHYDDGPTGPRIKNLARQSICKPSMKCEIRNHLPRESEV